jgi:hypothetical protein
VVEGVELDLDIGVGGLEAFDDGVERSLRGRVGRIGVDGQRAGLRRQAAGQQHGRREASQTHVSVLH